MEQFREIETKDGLVPLPTTPKTATTKPKKEEPTPKTVSMETKILFLSQQKLHKSTKKSF